MCKISIVIPVCNVENYVRECIESVMKQTLRDIEIICVDDASSDTSLEILRECAEEDERIKVLAYDTSKSASQARKDGVFLAKGEYILFLDADDYLERNACEDLYNAITKKNVDILQFGTNVINEGKVPERRIENMVKFLKPYHRYLRGKDVFQGCFIESKYRFTLWNKLYRNSLCKEALQYVKDGSFPKAQDLYAFFLLSYFSKSYYGIKGTYYNYRFGAGISGKEELSLPQLERYCCSVYVADALAEFISAQGETEYKNVVETLRESLLNECIQNWLSNISPEESAQGFDIICKYWLREEVVSCLCKRCFGKKKLLAERIIGAESIQYKSGNTIKTVGIFYHRYTPGGVQRVISMLIPMYMEIGYKVVLFMDEISEENEYELPSGVIRITLPSSLTIAKAEYQERATEFLAKVREYKIDVMCYQAASSRMVLFDMLLLKLYQIPVILTVHEVAFQGMLSMNPELTNRPAVYRLADYVTVLSRVEQKYWRCLGVNAQYVPNPIDVQLIERDLSLVEKDTILWIGRLDANLKRCLDVVNIMKHVVRRIPDAKLLVVGGEYTTGIQEKMESKIKKYGLEENVILCGYDTNVDPYYRRSQLHILTSISESFSMVIAESKSYGMPLVMYELPFVEFARDGRGIVSVPQGDMKRMAKAIISILSDEAYKRRLQKEAHDSLKDFISVDLKSEWKNIFSILGNTEKNIVEDETTCILLNSFLQHYDYGVTKSKKKKDSWRAKARALQNIEHTYDYMLGHALLFIPHIIVDGLKKIKGIFREKDDR